MPPRIEVDSHEDDWYQAPQPFTTSNDEPSPLFRDHDSTNNSPPSISCLDRRQSDPNFSVIVVKEDPIKLAVAPVVSRITAIIGPESAYVRTTSTPSPSNSPPLLSTIRPTSKATSQQKPQTTTTKSPNEKEKLGTKPVLLRATRFVSKKGWKVVKSLPKKVVSSVGSVKIPGYHRNVV